MDVTYVYTKLRSEFGKQCIFSDRGPELIDNYRSTSKYLGDYVYRNPVDQSTQCSREQAEHEVNTMRAKYTSTSMNHTEGGWPKDVNIHDEDQPKRYRRKIEKEESYAMTVMQLCKNMENCILQNNSVDIYEHYFLDTEPAPLAERTWSRTVNVYKDRSPETPTSTARRPVSHVSWSPDEGTKLAVTYCDLSFQSTRPPADASAFIWGVENPNEPQLTFRPRQPLVCLEYNVKDPNSLVAGMINGQVSVWDTRRAQEPVEVSVVEESHRDPVRSVLWISSKSGSEFFSGSSDGSCKWWDIRKMSEPLETLLLEPGGDWSRAQGVSCLEYEHTIPTRFMAGTEHGYVFSCNRKGKTAAEKMAAKFRAHLGPVYALERNSSFVKNFLTVGDWTARVWSEDCRESAIIWTGGHRSMLTSGGWSPTRYSVFYLTRDDGVLDAWDLLQQQKHSSLSMKVCDEALRCIRTHEAGRLLAVGSQLGTTYLIEVSENLATNRKNDKVQLTQMLERETHKEKIIEARMREFKLKQKQTAKPQPGGDDAAAAAAAAQEPESRSTTVEQALRTAEEEFFAYIDRETRPPTPPPPEKPEAAEGEEGPTESEPERAEHEPDAAKSKKGGKKDKAGSGKRAGKGSPKKSPKKK